MKIGVIGIGNMGRILTEAMLEQAAVAPSSLTITNRTMKKALVLKNKYHDISVVSTNKDVANNSDLIFLCLKPHDIFKVIQDILPYISKDKCLVSITSPISVDQLEAIVPCSVARVIPSITNRAKAGVSLVTFGSQCTGKWRSTLKRMFRKISVPIEIDEKVTRVASDIVSCGPAFFSYLTQRFITAAVKETEINEATANILASEMLIGLGELLKNGYYTLPTLQEKVCVKGGITGEGIKVLEEELGDVFEHVFHATHSKFREDIEIVKKQYPSINS
ncbi:late competence protein ComER [Bacillus sp. DNRA2]|uniref:late competence protein ComER n=1 Tax=Bacillus sp. DNRA2 TaxID=2723053 RepID=UPI00145DEBA4|nr:late competence protein ComER [Bacillus sp. DNRA2]NMD70633.1 late competence protein ComER [Bacillus sp. DNRA2]